MDGYSVLTACHDIEFITICCDNETFGRNIVLHNQQESEMQILKAQPRTLHYFATLEEKDRLKASYGFNSVPFYVMLDERGETLHSGRDLWQDILSHVSH